MVKMKSNVSVVIRVRNEQSWIGHCIQSVLDFIEKPEIIIVDNNSTDESIKYASLFLEDPNLDKKNSNYTKIKFLKIQNYTPGRAINLGVKQCSNKYILLISAHCILQNLNKEKLINSLKKNIAVFGRQIPRYHGKKISRRYIWSHFGEKAKINMYSNLENRFFFHNALSFFKKQTLVKYPFDEKLTSKEDRYWAQSMIKKKMRIHYLPEFFAEHHYTPDGSTWKNF